jgi:hypothetical protein
MFVRHYAVLMGPDLPVTSDVCSAHIFVIALNAGNCRVRVVTKPRGNQIILPRSEREKLALRGLGGDMKLLAIVYKQVRTQPYV